jgi:hypothetical protein
VSLSHAWDKTYEAVERQLTAMGADLFEVGAFQRGDGDQPQFMLLRIWDQEKVIQSIPCCDFRTGTRATSMCGREGRAV